jgi:hypothetical protein
VVAGDASEVFVIGLATDVHVTGAETAKDRFTVNALAGDDVVNASDLTADAIQFAADAGEATTFWLAAPATTRSAAAPVTTS